jgi:vancomycin resistance protein YoaR
LNKLWAKIKRDRYIYLSGVLLSLAIPAMLWTSGLAQAGLEVGETVVLIDDGRIAEGVHIGSLNVSNKGAQSALELLGARIAAGDAKLVLVLPDRTIEVPIKDLPVTPKPEEAVNKAMAVGRAGSAKARADAQFDAQTKNTVVYMPYSFDAAALQTALSSITAAIPRNSVQGSFTFDPSLPERFRMIRSIRGFTPDEPGLINNVQAALASGDIGHVEVPGTASTEVVDEGTTEAALANVTLVGKFTTSVKGSSGRISNIRTASTMINGKIVKPGEVFSTNDILGPRNAAAGIWKKAPAIAGGEIEEQLGGGICQVSTTLFNAVARADLEIVEWVHHSIPSSYVKIGCDATINTGGPDFKFKNNTAWPVYIVYLYDEKTKKLTCEVWGRPLPDGMTIDITGRLVGTVDIPATVNYTDDPERVSAGRIGKYSRTYKIWYAADGKEIRREEISRHLYPARGPVYLLTPSPSPTEPPSPDPDPTPAP